MSRAAVEWAKKVKAGSAGAKHVLRALADYAGENGYCWPGVKRLANETEQSVNTVRKRIVELMAAGLVHRFDRARTQGSPDTNGYILLIDEAAKAFAVEKGWTAPAARPVGAKPAAPVQTAFDFGAQEGPLQDVSWDSPEAMARANPDPGLAVESAAGLIPNPAVPVDNEADGRPPDWGRVVQPAEGGSSSLLDHKDPTFESLSDPSPPNPLRGNGRGDDPPDEKKDLWFQFEAVYPFDETEPRHPARKAFNRLGEADQKLAIAHAKRYGDDCLRRNRKICHAKTWLRDRGWEPFVALAAKAAALGRPVEMIWIAKGSSEWDAWDAYLVAMRAGRLVAFQTRGRKGLGCWKETRFPPRGRAAALRSARGRVKTIDRALTIFEEDWMTQTTQTTQEPEAAPPLGGDERGEWAIVEIMGHRKHAGLTFEVERFGTKMLRIDVPKDGDPGGHPSISWNHRMPKPASPHTMAMTMMITMAMAACSVR